MLFNKYEEVSEKFEVETVSLAKKLDIILKKEEEVSHLLAENKEEKK